ncbi:hypothetical protein DSO57_1014573 [Entomophthora muscae]|uniref:Uncharacterized protein n=1 Tax=Entomophthora muscae TaxID=34485 RepID=A0ACC2SUJ9_9FUNG|nr:hypothetical protein DSO57_1014573 [Entomophthora muscae]
MIKYIISALVVASQAYSTKDASCGYEPKMIFYGEENPKLYQVPVRPDMNATFKASNTNWRVASTIRDMHTRLLAAQKLYDPKLPTFIVEAKVNTIMRLLFQDGQDILNFLYNTPDEPCPSKQAASHAHSILISDSHVTINYLSAEGNQPEETYYNQSHGQGISDYFKPSSRSYNDTSSDYHYYKSNSTRVDYTPYSSNNTRSNNQGSYPNYHQYNSSNIERGNSSYSQSHHSSLKTDEVTKIVPSHKNHTSKYDDEYETKDDSDEYQPSKNDSDSDSDYDDYEYSDYWF